MKIGFHKQYFFLCVFLFLLEVCIAVFVKDSFIRPFIGDVLVVWLLYTFVRIFHAGSPGKIAAGIFAFACFTEAGQYFNLVSVLKLQDSKIAGIILGSTFDWKDILAYALGSLVIFMGTRLKAVESPR